MNRYFQIKDAKQALHTLSLLHPCYVQSSFQNFSTCQAAQTRGSNGRLCGDRAVVEIHGDLVHCGRLCRYGKGTSQCCTHLCVRCTVTLTFRHLSTWSPRSHKNPGRPGTLIHRANFSLPCLLLVVARTLDKRVLYSSINNASVLLF